MPAKRKPEPWRSRLTVPAADTSCQKWLELQDDHSVSVRLLIRESIERHGYVDVMNRPVDQLPRRGRPPATEQSDSETDLDRSSDGEGPSEDESNTEDSAESPSEAEAEQAEPSEPSAKAAEKKESPGSAPSGMDAFLTG